MARGAVWKGYIAFGLLSIPVRLVPAARGQHVAFHQVHAVCNTRIKQQLWCPHCERVVTRDEVVNGYETSSGTIVQVPAEELRKIAPPSTETMDIAEFVEITEIDPIYYDTSYYVLPEAPGKKAYRVLTAAMEKTGYAGVAKAGMHRREFIVVIRPHRDGLALHTLHYRDEVRAMPEIGNHTAEPDPREIEMAVALIRKLSGQFRPELFEDTYRASVKKLIEAKARGREVKVEPARKMAPVIDLMEALKQSIGERKPVAKAKARPAKRARAKAS